MSATNYAEALESAVRAIEIGATTPQLVTAYYNRALNGNC